MFSENSSDAGPFTDVASAWGDQFWVFLNEPSSIASMVNASENGRTAAESVASELIRRFDVDIRQHRVKQFIGYLIRQVMEQNGFKHTSYGQKTRDNPVFVTASVYTRKEE